MTVKVIEKGVERSFNCCKGENLLSVLQKNGYKISADCGGTGKCGKCKVQILSNIKTEYVLACETFIDSDLIVKLDGIEGAGLITDRDIKAKNKEEGIGLVLDIGTTSLAYYFVDLIDGNTIKTQSSLNPQKSFGADIISRITYSINNGVKPLHDSIIKEVNDKVKSFGKRIKKLFVTGNTVMLHIFLGKEVSSFGFYPFTPEFLDLQTVSGKELCLSNVETVCVLPSFSSFVGADVVSGGIATDIEDGNNILIDLGTNGEILMHFNGKYYTTSVAAGPAFEGANIECGTGGVSGAIKSIQAVDGVINIETVDKLSPDGICGSGLIDAVRYLIENKIIDESGAFHYKDDRFYFTDKVYVSAKDIREFQLAKSAVRSGIETLINKVGDYKDIDNVFIAGGLGYFINKESAVKVGLIPYELKDKIKTVGNTAGLGAKMCMLNDALLNKAVNLSKKAENVELNGEPFFAQAFIDNMAF